MPRRRRWTAEEREREAAARRARVRRDAARGVSENLEESVTHSRIAQAFADAFRHVRKHG